MLAAEQATIKSLEQQKSALETALEEAEKERDEAARRGSGAWLVARLTTKCVHSCKRFLSTVCRSCRFVLK